MASPLLRCEVLSTAEAAGRIELSLPWLDGSRKSLQRMLAPEDAQVASLREEGAGDTTVMVAFAMLPCSWTSPVARARRFPAGSWPAEGPRRCRCTSINNQLKRT